MKAVIIAVLLLIFIVSCAPQEATTDTTDVPEVEDLGLDELDDLSDIDLDEISDADFEGFE
ncbi:hypothetical protein HOK09_00760 [Candidatus Woesearchaeota archaeon]|mgnify:FL=1|jgi:hypothetical protein|nr:hypothetical protein [Candidatus Woesearchaeota archaeon]